MQAIGQRRSVGCGLGNHGGSRWYHRRPMIFVDYLGPADAFERAREVVSREVAAAMRVPSEQVCVRRIVTEGGHDETELWVELSTDEQLYRLGQPISQRLTAALRPDGTGPDVWVMFRIVPLSHAFLNGAARGRGTPTFD